MVLNQSHGCWVIVLALALLLSSCSTTKVVKHGEPFVHEGAATLVTRDGMAQKISSVRQVGDSLVVAFHQAEVRIPAEHAEKIEYVSKGRGIASGFWIGPLVGAGIGVVLGASPVGNCDPGGGACIFGGPGGMGVFMALMGLFVGPVMGGQVGAKVSVLFDSTSYVPPDSNVVKRRNSPFLQHGTDYR